MRKILLGTTAVVGAALMGMSYAQAQTAPSVRVGGFLFLKGIWADDDADRGVAIGANPTGAQQQRIGRRDRFDFTNEVEVHVLVTGKAANGMSYGAVIELQNDNSGASGAGSAVDLDEAYGFISTPTLGTLRFGEEDNAASIMQVRVPTIAGMGPDGDWDDNLAARNVTGLRRADRAAPSILTGINDGNDATKIVYLSPQFFGFDFGVSYAANSGEGERMWRGLQPDRGDLPTAIAQRDRSDLRNEIAGAVRYRGSFGNVGVAAGFGAMRADAQDPAIGGAALRDVTAYSAGVNVTAFGFTVGGEYTWGRYSGESVGRSAQAAGRDNSNHYVLGATYTIGAVAIGGYFGEGEQDNGPAGADREQRIWGVGVTYSLAPGLDLLAQYNNLRDRNGPGPLRPQTLAGTPAGNTREADVILVGARLAF
ncbi:MAG TPA: porin [Acetobacteraceae bacterium]|nr:porin [Acetobacteraceae bacterium]